MTSDVSIGMELVANDAVKAWTAAMGPIRAKFGTDDNKNAVWGSDSQGCYKKESSFFFGDGCAPDKRPMQSTAVLNNCTLALIKPHVIADG